MRCKTREMGCDANLLSLYVLLALSSQLSVILKLCITNILVHFLLSQLCRSLRNVSLGCPHIPSVDLIKKSYHGWLGMMVSSESPLFQPCLGSPNPKTTTGATVSSCRSAINYYFHVNACWPIIKVRCFRHEILLEIPFHTLLRKAILLMQSCHQGAGSVIWHAIGDLPSYVGNDDLFLAFRRR